MLYRYWHILGCDKKKVAEIRKILRFHNAAKGPLFRHIVLKRKNSLMLPITLENLQRPAVITSNYS